MSLNSLDNMPPAHVDYRTVAPGRRRQSSASLYRGAVILPASFRKTVIEVVEKLIQPLKWHGGKHYLASKIVALMPPHLHYVEPFAGGAAVLLARDSDRDWWGNGKAVLSGQRGCSEVINDIDGELMNFWRCLQEASTSGLIQAWLESTPFSEVEYLAASKPERKRPGGFDAYKARLFFIHCRQSLAGRMGGFASLSKTRTRRGMNEQASAWMNAIDGLPAVHQRLQKVVILNDDAMNVIRSQDGDKTLFYLDPPYWPGTRTSPTVYRHEMSRKDHCRLLSLLADDGVVGFSMKGVRPSEFQAERKYRIQGKWMLSGYRCPPYDATAALNGWHRVDFELPNHAAGGGSKRRMTESLWMNF